MGCKINVQNGYKVVDKYCKDAILILLFRNTCIPKATGKVKGRREWTQIFGNKCHYIDKVYNLLLCEPAL